ncbi:MAG: hypothetical protein CFE26_09405 [Verrucomicrobiales bacterium VVV1]|nr:MAG: hypothetical protein CFE26_09405 [Verrucomicrobiales bacterium VVV1]
MTQRPGASLKAETELKLTYIGGTFATYPVDRYELEMFEGHLVKGKVFLVMPSGTAKNGGLLSDHQFEDLCKSLTSKYGKVPRITDGQHAESNWSWTTTNPRTRQKRTTEVRLSYWFFRREFSISYSNLPTAPVAAESQDAKLKEETKKKDL